MIILDEKEYIPFDKIISQLPLRRGSMVMITADLTRIAFLSRRNGLNFDTGIFIDSIQEHLGPEGTLIIPSFNFNLRDKDHYSRVKTLPVTGSLAVEALKRNDFLRTRNPLHSFLVWGKQAKILVDMENISSFGSDSPFAFFREHNAVMLMIDTKISDAFTFVHHVEEMENVRYRMMKKIRIYLEDEKLWKDYLLFAKKKGWTMNMKGLETLMLRNEIARIHTINRIPYTIIDISASCPFIQQDIRENRSGNVARFNLKLYLRDTAKAWLSAAGIQTLSDKISHDPGLL